MTPITLPLKERHEVAIANQLLRFLRLDNAKLIRHGTDGIEPDAIYSINGRIVGIEVATAYYNQKHAKGEWQFVRGILKPDPTGWAKICDVIAFPDKLIEASVQSEIEDKCAKTYSGVDEAWLCIERHAQATEVAETEDFLPRLKIPNIHPFVRMYLGFHACINDGGGFRVYDLLNPPREVGELTMVT